MSDADSQADGEQELSSEEPRGCGDSGLEAVETVW